MINRKTAGFFGKRFNASAIRFFQSIWFFPALLLLPVVIFTILGISGTSIGAYHNILYGKTPDPALILNQPRGIRSDEWLVNTQQTIIQSRDNFPRDNTNIGDSEDVSTTDVPYKEWSILFKPQNWAFFVLPLDNAFALKWWAMAYLLVVSCYFFVLAVLPRRRLIATSLSSALFFSGFVQWWYVYGTLASLYYPLIILTAIIYLFRQKVLWKRIAISALITYAIACFALVLYPPFQIACGLVAVAFLAGYMAENYAKWGRAWFLRNLLWLVGSTLVALVIIGAFVFTRIDTVKTITNTAYPGKRTMQSGDFYFNHFMSSHLGHEFTSDERTAKYLIDGKSVSNQSETSNFLLIAPFLIIPSIILVYFDIRKKKKLDWPLILLNGLFLVFVCQMFVPAFTPIARLFLLDQVGGSRLLIGMGLLNTLVFILLIRHLANKKLAIPRLPIVLYSLLVLACCLLFALHAHFAFDGFIRLRSAIAYSLPIPAIIYLLFTKRFIAASLLYFAFSFYISATVNPLYKGLGTITRNPIIQAISEIGAKTDDAWVSEGGYLEHVASMSGERSLSGVYNYPQFELWQNIPNTPSKSYNRYAHVGFQINDTPAAPASIKLITADSFVVHASSCSPYLRQQDIHYVVTATILKGGCSKLEKTLSFPLTTLYIYKLD